MALALLLLQAACATVAPAPTQYAQSMNSAVDGCLRNPACVASMPGEEAVIPWLTRAPSNGPAPHHPQGVPRRSRTAPRRSILVECAKEADFQVNEREYGPGKYPDDAECKRVVGYKDGEAVTRAIELGDMKHAVAFACVERRLLSRFPDNISVEPRYGKNPSTDEYVLTDRLDGLLRARHRPSPGAQPHQGSMRLRLQVSLHALQQGQPAH